ncbi:MAG: Rieske 2Fe-2S domain-containing protein [Acidimicrobiia bacterium]|nr:Rieske 2Fe-2S domain-containing protein [Acidimicrobiia bacterium]MBT8214503.1 Rieske 2Fe-2S domain-containing protein [Acidimicrobiia bacterium]NNF68795.1 Rieske 2Fe-2S domain-containing protein [Acidimicrobiia bacterium]
MQRRNFLSNLWKGAVTLIAAAGAWTTWDLLRPVSAGATGRVRAVSPDAVPEGGVIEIRAARAYLVKIDDQITAISEKCTHLGCRVPYCDSSSQFECPCHGSVFNRLGEFQAGPAPRGLDRYAVEVGEDGLLYIDTDTLEDGPAPGVDTLNEPPTGPSCTEGSH